MSTRPGYDEYMRSVAWAEKREQRLAIDGHRCRTCGATADEYPLQVHHVTYVRLGCEDVQSDLITLCSLCHQAITDTMRRRRYAARFVDVEFEPIMVVVASRPGVTDYGMANTSVQVDFIGSATHAQRADGRPTKQVGKVDEADFVQARQDRRGL